VQPAAEYISLARMRGARVAVINTDAEDLGVIGRLESRDYLFQGDASKILPEILKPVIGELADYASMRDEGEWEG
jgi:NAD-dependent deacetylase sirtuin 5